jgi:hypothetical protein
VCPNACRVKKVSNRSVKNIETSQIKQLKKQLMKLKEDRNSNANGEQGGDFF